MSAVYWCKICLLWGVALPHPPNSAFAILKALVAHELLPCGIRRDTPARGFGRASLVVGQRVFFVLLSHSRRYDRAGLGAVVFGGV